MIEYVIVFMITLFLGVFYKFYYAPKKALNWYKKTIEGLGYKVKLLPVQILGCSFYTLYAKNAQKYNDSQYQVKRQYPKYDILLYNMLDKPMVSILNPQLTQSFYLPDNIYVHYKVKFLIQNIQRSLGMGLAFSEGKQWKRKKQIISTVFNYDFIIQIIPKINRICEDTLNDYQKQCKQSGYYKQENGKQTYNIKVIQIFSKVFSNVIIQCFFGIVTLNQKIKDHSAAKFINTLNQDINEQSFCIPVLLFGTKFVELGLRQIDRSINQRVKILRQFAKGLIERRLQEIQKDGVRQKYQDIVEALVFKKSFDKNSTNANKVKTQSTISYDFNELIQQFCTFFTGGTQTTSNFIQMIIYLVSKDKRIQNKLREHIDSIIKSEQDITKENLKKLYYIDWIQNQTLRFYGPGNGIFARISQKDHYIGKIPIMKGTCVDVNPNPSHYNQLYYKNPHQFRPERWQKQCENNHPYAFVGFSGGPRNCIGKHLALLESKIGLVKFFRRYKQTKLPKQDFKLTQKFLYVPEPMRLQVSK